MTPEIIPPEVLLGAYSQGIFPMAHEGELLWFEPEMRGIIPLDHRFHIPHGLARRLRKNPFQVRWDTAFRQVMLGCADRQETWIDQRILDSYCHLHQLGFAHSVECWDHEGLQGGLYGIALCGAFFGESMFTRKTDASKIALVHLVQRLRHHGYVLLDTQWLTPHLATFGAYELPRADYREALTKALAIETKPLRPSSS